MFNKVKMRSLIGAIVIGLLMVFGTACGNSEKAEKEYVEWYDEYRVDIEGAMLTYAKRMMEIEPGSKEWFKSVKKSLDGLQKVVDSVENKKNVPAAYKKAHEYLLKANAGYQYLIDETPSSIRTMNEDSVAALETIEKRVDSALDETNKADDEVNKVRKDNKDKK
ncbi:hypothetical protein LAV39_01390 [Bacillus pumilus]|uniref:hypothetical protein n=1 Tax=Bacillus pumilus TaxID=1408 RepID=UPI002B252D04|nr:hypothetical protein [Bacillus pumilus]MEB2356342.1 hypothetical protein [Bacillus pumilus]